MAESSFIQEDLTPAGELWEAAAGFYPEFSPEERRAGLVLLRELTGGQPVGAAQLSRALGAPIDATESLLWSSELSPFVVADDDGRVLSFWGLSTVPTDHRFNLGDRTLWTWCALDTLFLPELLGETAPVESKDPESGELARLTISPRGVESVEPEQGVGVSINSPESWDKSSATQIITTACHFIHFFTSRESAERWVTNHPNSVLLPVEEAFEYGKRMNTRVFGAGSAAP